MKLPHRKARRCTPVPSRSSSTACTTEMGPASPRPSAPAAGNEDDPTDRRARKGGDEPPREAEVMFPGVSNTGVGGDAPEDGLGPIEGLTEGRGVIDRALDHIGPGQKPRLDPRAVASDGPDGLSGRDELRKHVATDLAGWRGDDEHGTSC